MGTEVARVSGTARVASPDPSFGSWLKQQRELRRIPLGYVAARTRIPSDRLARIESGEEALGRDGQGRSTARLLALTIGADPDEAGCLLNDPVLGVRRGGGLAELPWFRWGLLGVGAIASTLGLWVLANRVLSSEASHDASPEVVYRPDYVDRLLQLGEAAPADVAASGAEEQPASPARQAGELGGGASQ